MAIHNITPARYARYIPQRYRLEAQYCKECDKWFFPPRIVTCCGKHESKNELEIRRLPDEGTLLSFTVIHTPSSQFTDEKPFAIGIIELAPGANITAQIADCPFDEIEIGMKVKIQFRKVQTVGSEGVLAYGYKVVKI